MQCGHRHSVAIDTKRSSDEAKHHCPNVMCFSVTSFAHLAISAAST
jgi:hypothetical protein